MSDNIEVKIRYLEMIQNIMTRMSTNSFMLKGWAVTLIAGIFALSAKEANPIYFLLAYVPAILFWLLDAYYLMLERQYKHLYNLSTEKAVSDIDFKIKRPKAHWENKTCYCQCLMSTTELFFYIPTAILVAIVVVLGRSIV